MLPLFGTASLADDDTKADLEKIQGSWEIAGHPTDPQARRVVKEIKGNDETLTFYGEGNAVLRQHRNSFKLTSQNGTPSGVRIWTYGQIEFTEGPQKGTKTPADFSGAYIYRVDADTIYEAQGLLDGDQQKGISPLIFSWKRVKKTD